MQVWINLWHSQVSGFFLGPEHKTQQDAERGRMNVESGKLIDAPAKFIACLVLPKP